MDKYCSGKMPRPLITTGMVPKGPRAQKTNNVEKMENDCGGLNPSTLLKEKNGKRKEKTVSICGGKRSQLLPKAILDKLTKTPNGGNRMKP